MNRQLYPDFLRASALTKIVIFHFFAWQLLTYLPSLGIMFGLGGWFIANSLNNKPQLTVIFHRLARLLPTWWAFALLTTIAGFFYAQGTNIPLHLTLAWLFPYQQVTWSLDNDYANGATCVTWYIATYIWLLLLSPLLLYVYKKLSWITIFLCMLIVVIYSCMAPSYQQTTFGQTWYYLLTFSGCWILGFTKADGTINNVPRYFIWAITTICCAFAILLTYHNQSLASNPIALSLMSFGVAFLLLSLNPDLSKLPQFIKSLVRIINTYAVTIYLFHNIAINIAFKLSEYFNLYDYGHSIGNLFCFIIAIGLIYVITKTVGIVETHKWVKHYNHDKSIIQT